MSSTTHLVNLSVAIMLSLSVSQQGTALQADGNRKTGPGNDKDCCTVEVGLPGFTSRPGASGTHPAVSAMGNVPRHVYGNPNADVRVIVYEDLQCPDCAVFGDMIENFLLRPYGGSVAIEIRDFPLPKHSWAREAAIVARFLETKDSQLAAGFRRRMRQSIDAVNRNGFKYALSSFCRKNRLNVAELEAALIDPRYADAVDSDFRQGFEMGIRKTPTVIVGDSKFIETIDLGRLRSAIEQQLTAARRARQGAEK